MHSSADQRIVIVTRATQLAALRRRFATRAQVQFQLVSAKRRELARAGTPVKRIEQLAEAAFAELEEAARVYDATVSTVRRDLESAGFDLSVQTVDREFVPNFVFGGHDVVVTIGQDGLVANTAKYVLGQPIIAVNPDPLRFDGLLLPFRADQVRTAVQNVLNGRARSREVTLAQATLANGQKLLGFNELFIGCRSHASARYRLKVAERSESQSSSGILICTGAGSTGWLSSVFNMAAGITAAFAAEPDQSKTKKDERGDASGHGRRGVAGRLGVRLEWNNPNLIFVVREPFLSRTSHADLTAGMLPPGRPMVVESEMAGDGVIFSDGVESDYLEFNSGAIAQISAADRRAKIVVP